MKKLQMGVIAIMVALGMLSTAGGEIDREVGVHHHEGGHREPVPALLSEKEAAKDEKPQVELYVTAWCFYCKKAADFFRKRGIEFVEYDIEKDREAARRKWLLDRKRGVPFAVINGYRIHGYSEVLYERALKARP